MGPNDGLIGREPGRVLRGRLSRRSSGRCSVRQSVEHLACAGRLDALESATHVEDEVLHIRAPGRE